MNVLPDPMISAARQESLVELAQRLAPRSGYNPTGLPSVRILRSETELEDVPVLYRPGAVFVLQGAKQGFVEKEIYRYDADHYLAVSVPVPFRMASQASREEPLLAVYLDFDLSLASETAARLRRQEQVGRDVPARSLVSSPMEPWIADTLYRLLHALAHPEDLVVLGEGLLREIHYRVLIGPQGRQLAAAMQQGGAAGRIVRSLASIRENFDKGLSVAKLSAAAGMSVASYHVHFRALTGTSPIQYIKAVRLHEARRMIARREGTISVIAAKVGYASAAQFSRDFRRHFRRTASEEARWLREHIGDLF